MPGGPISLECLLHSQVIGIILPDRADCVGLFDTMHGATVGTATMQYAHVLASTSLVHQAIAIHMNSLTELIGLLEQAGQDEFAATVMQLQASLRLVQRVAIEGTVAVTENISRNRHE